MDGYNRRMRNSVLDYITEILGMGNDAVSKQCQEALLKTNR
jgi:hypothetical protein